MIETLISRAMEKNQHHRQRQPVTTPAGPFLSGIPTLKADLYRKASPMLAERFSMFGRWKDATHGHWLSIDDMTSLWSSTADPFLAEIKGNLDAGEDWPNEASALFKPERLSLFACSDLNYVKIYLLWLDSEDELELWVYDQNGESRYRNLGTYLIAYLDDDVRAPQKTWRA